MYRRATACCRGCGGGTGQPDNAPSGDPLLRTMCAPIELPFVSFLLHRRCPSTSTLTIPCCWSWRGRMQTCSKSSKWAAALRAICRSPLRGVGGRTATHGGPTAARLLGAVLGMLHCLRQPCSRRRLTLAIGPAPLPSSVALVSFCCTLPCSHCVFVPLSVAVLWHAVRPPPLCMCRRRPRHASLL